MYTFEPLSFGAPADLGMSSFNNTMNTINSGFTPPTYDSMFGPGNSTWAQTPGNVVGAAFSGIPDFTPFLGAGGVPISPAISGYHQYMDANKYAALSNVKPFVNIHGAVDKPIERGSLTGSPTRAPVPTTGKGVSSWDSHRLMAPPVSGYPVQPNTVTPGIKPYRGGAIGTVAPALVAASGSPSIANATVMADQLAVRGLLNPNTRAQLAAASSPIML